MGLESIILYVDNIRKVVIDILRANICDESKAPNYSYLL